jgi:MinD superfamily P-loop ATPase
MVISVASGKGGTGKTMVENPNGETKAAVAEIWDSIRREL